MDGARFDDLLRALLAGASRRGLLRLSALPLAAGLPAWLAADEASAAKKKRKKCKGIKHKCKKRLKRKRKSDEAKNCRSDVCVSGCPFSSLQAAIDAAAPGDTISICPGGYEPIVIDKDLTLVGLGPFHPVLNANAAVVVVKISGSPTVEMRNLILSSGVSADGGVIGSHGATRGGGIDIGAGGTMTLIDCIVEGNNTLGDGGGIYNGGILTLDGTSVKGNRSRSSNSRGGGIYNNGTLSLDGTSVTGNVSIGNGGGIGNSGTLTLDAASRVTDNNASFGSGIANEGEVTCAARTVTGNETDQCVDANGGSGCDSCVP
jgi:hypothetical protein